MSRIQVNHYSTNEQIAYLKFDPKGMKEIKFNQLAENPSQSYLIYLFHENDLYKPLEETEISKKSLEIGDYL